MELLYCNRIWGVDGVEVCAETRGVPPVCRMGQWGLGGHRRGRGGVVEPQPVRACELRPVLGHDALDRGHEHARVDQPRRLCSAQGGGLSGGQESAAAVAPWRARGARALLSGAEGRVALSRRVARAPRGEGGRRGCSEPGRSVGTLRCRAAA